MIIPDYKKYTIGEHTPELLEVQQKLAERGLKDPWLRYDFNKMSIKIFDHKHFFKLIIKFTFLKEDYDFDI